MTIEEYQKYEIVEVLLIPYPIEFFLKLSSEKGSIRFSIEQIQSALESGWL